MAEKVTATVGSWRAVYNGARLADIESLEHPGRSVACMQVGDWDDTGRWGEQQRATITPASLQRELEEWIGGDNADEVAEHVLPYLGSER